MNQDIYKLNIFDHYKYPHHKGVLDPCDAQAEVTNSNCGDALTLYLMIAGQTITASTFMGDGCALSIAGASMLTDTLTGMSLKDARTLTEADIGAFFGVSIVPARTKCAMLAYRALREALHTYG